MLDLNVNKCLADKGNGAYVLNEGSAIAVLTGIGLYDDWLFLS